MVTRSRFEKLIKALFEIDGRGAGHVIEVIAFPIPRERWSHGGAIARMKEVVGAGEVLLFSKGGCRVAKVWCVIIEKTSTVLSRCATGESDAHGKHRLHCSRFHSQQVHSPFGKRVR